MSILNPTDKLRKNTPYPTGYDRKSAYTQILDEGLKFCSASQTLLLL